MTAQVEKNVGTILSTLRHKAHYHHRISVVSYYSTDYRDPAVTGGIGALNAALARAAAANDAVVADGFGAMAKAAAVAGGDTCAAGLLDRAARRRVRRAPDPGGSPGAGRRVLAATTRVGAHHPSEGAAQPNQPGRSLSRRASRVSPAGSGSAGSAQPGVPGRGRRRR